MASRPVLAQVVLLALAGAFGTVSIAASIAAPVAARPEAPAANFGVALDVSLVEVELRASDHQGRPLAGLRRDEVELRVDGEPVEIASFEAHGGLEPADGEARTPAEPLALAVFVDQAFLQPGDWASAREALEFFLARSLPAGSRVAVVRGDLTLDRIVGFVEPGEAAARLAALPSGIGRGQALMAEYRELSRSIQRDARSPVDQLSQDPESVSRPLLSRIAALASEAQRQAEATAAQLERLCDAMAGLPGRRAILVIGGRPPVGAAEALVAAWQGAFGRNSAQQTARLSTGQAESDNPSFPTLPPELFGIMEERLDRAAAYAAARAVTVHVADLAGSRRSAVGTLALDSADGGDSRGGGLVAQSRRESSRQLRERRALEALALDTGGQFMAQGQGLEEGLRALAESLSGYYTVAFTPPSGATGEDDRLEVTVRRAGRWTVSHRARYRVVSSDRGAAERTLAALLMAEPAAEPGSTAPPPAAAADRGAELLGLGNALGIEVEAGARRVDEAGAAWLPLTVRVPLSRLALVPAGRVHNGHLSIFAVAGDLHVGVPPVRKALVPIRLPNEELLTAQGRQVEYRFELPLPVDAPRAAICVRDDLAAVLSTVLLPLIPPPVAVSRGSAAPAADPAPAGGTPHSAPPGAAPGIVPGVVPRR
jgi:VWFA-related protein